MATASANPMPTKPLVAIVSPERIRLTASGADRILPSGLCAICRAGAAFVCMSRLDQKRDAATQHGTNASGEIPSPGARHHCSCINTRGHRVRKKRDLIYVPELLPASPGAPTASLSQPLTRLWPNSGPTLARLWPDSGPKRAASLRTDRNQCSSGAASAAQIACLRAVSVASARELPAALAFSISSRMLASACSKLVMGLPLRCWTNTPREKPSGWLMRGKCEPLTARRDGHGANMKRVATTAHARDCAPNRGTLEIRS